jgi:hypothetical protein
MKNFIFSIFVLFLGVLPGTLGCKKGHQFMNQGVIVGWNYGSCVTCGGFYVNMSNDTVKGPATYYVLNWSDAAQPLISGYFSQYNKNHLPTYVSFDWQPVSLNVPGDPANWIRVTAIESR